ncbi:MAG: cell division protein ZipA C-terminal FtsZ-binding domain-containing protein [Legionellales bacterium]
MQTNWSLIINVLLLVGVLVAIGRLMTARKQSLESKQYQPSLGQAETSLYAKPSYDDAVIAVRKLNPESGLTTNLDVEPELQLPKKTTSTKVPPQIMPQVAEETEQETHLAPENDFIIGPRQLKPVFGAPPTNGRSASEARSSLVSAATTKTATLGTEKITRESSTLMIFLVAKRNRQFAGYELLQTILTAGLRFGEGSLFYRHQSPNGQGPILCGLAAATPAGTFDLQNIGAFSIRGLCLFMYASKNPVIDAERFSIMLETAEQLSEGLNATLLDEQRNPLTAERIKRYYRMLNVDSPELECAIA